MNKITSIMLTILQGIVLISCINGDDTYVTCGEITYVKDFPVEVTLDESEPWMSDLIGTTAIKGIDTLMISIARNNHYNVSLYSSFSGKKLIDIFPQGKGPGEYFDMPTLRCLKNDEDSCYGIFRYHDHLFTLNLTATAETGQEVKSDFRYTPKMDIMRTQVPLDNGDTLVVYRKEYGLGGFDRAIRSSSGEKMILSLGSVCDDWRNVDSNNLGILPIFLSDDSIIAEAMIALNQIVAYSPYNEKVRKTVCVGDRLTPVPKDNFIDRRKKIRAYGGSQAFNDKVAFLYHGLEESDYQNNKGASELQIFDSEINPLTRLKFPFIIESFFIDNSGNLFGFSHLGETEAVYKWDISQYIN